MSFVPYSSAVGNVIYAMVCTSTTFHKAMSIVNHFMMYPSKTLQEVVQWMPK